jgi:hypothetical protein
MNDKGKPRNNRFLLGALKNQAKSKKDVKSTVSAASDMDVDDNRRANELLFGGSTKTVNADNQVKSSSETPLMQRCKGQGTCEYKEGREGGMPTKDFARSLSLRTSRRLGSAPVRLACTQRGPKRGLVLVCSGRREKAHSSA